MKKECILYKTLSDGKVMCTACSHMCQIEPWKYWECGIRKNIDWKLYLMVRWKALWVHVDPVEKKPLFHFYPWEPVFSWWTAWCNFHCLYCQNRQMSQIKWVDDIEYLWEDLPPEAIVEFCKQNNINLLAATYNEPTVFFEYAFDTFKLAKQYWMKTIFVSNGYESKFLWEKILEKRWEKYLNKYLDAINIDLKAFNEEFYVKLTWWHLEPVKKNIEFIARQTNVWLEVTTLLIPWYNTDPDELKRAAEWLASISTDIPWHLTAFHPAWKMMDVRPTSPEELLMAYEIAKQAGMKYVYVWNVYLPWYEDTYCPNCWERLIARAWFNARPLWQKPWVCPKCGTKIPGVWK